MENYLLIYGSPKLVYEDSMDLIAKLPTVAATIYRNLYRDGSSIGAIDTTNIQRLTS